MIIGPILAYFRVRYRVGTRDTSFDANNRLIVAALISSTTFTGRCCLGNTHLPTSLVIGLYSVQVTQYSSVVTIRLRDEMAAVSRGSSASQERHKSKSIAFSLLANKRNVCIEFFRLYSHFI